MDIVSQYPGLEDRGIAEAALHELRALSWLTNGGSENAPLTMQAPNLPELIADRLKDASVPYALAALRPPLDPTTARVLGPMDDGDVYSSYLDLLGSAQNEICLPMLVTSPKIASVPILQQRAKAGVRIKILVGSPQVVAELRGETMRPRAVERIKEWCHNFDGLPTADVRISYRVEDMWLASCMAIDGRIVRFDVYDPEEQRSLQGIMLEVANPHGLKLNLVRIFAELFEAAWLRARPMTWRGRLAWYMRRTWRVWVCVLFAALAFIPVPLRGWFDFTAGIAAALIATLIIDFGTSVRLRRKRRRRVS
jgi:hypothetical protein